MSLEWGPQVTLMLLALGSHFENQCHDYQHSDSKSSGCGPGTVLSVFHAAEGVVVLRAQYSLELPSW